MNKLMVFGANSQDGLSIANLCDFKEDIVFVVRRKSEYLEKVKYLEVIDSYDCATVVKLLDKYQPQYCLNLIAQSSVGLSYKIPEETHSINYDLCMDLIHIVLTNSASHFLQASSSYIFDCTRPIGPESKICSHSPYARSKAKLYMDCKKHILPIYGNRITFFHLFNHVSCFSDERFVLPRIVKTFLRNDESFPLHLADINKSRDWGFSQDYMQAIISLCEQAVDNKLDFEYFIGSGLQLKVNDIIETLSAITNKTPNINITKKITRSADPDAVVLDERALFHQNIDLPSYTKEIFCEKLINMFRNSS